MLNSNFPYLIILPPGGPEWKDSMRSLWAFGMQSLNTVFSYYIPGFEKKNKHALSIWNRPLKHAKFILMYVKIFNQKVSKLYVHWLFFFYSTSIYSKDVNSKYYMNID